MLGCPANTEPKHISCINEEKSLHHFYFLTLLYWEAVILYMLYYLKYEFNAVHFDTVLLSLSLGFCSEDISVILTAATRTGQMGRGWGWGRSLKAKNIIMLVQTRIGLEFLSAEISSIFFQTKLDLVWNLFPSKFDTIIFQTKLDLVWKSWSII